MLFLLSSVRKFATGLDRPGRAAVGRGGTLSAGCEAGQGYRISPDGEAV
jgi:hypothetical protein